MINPTLTEVIGLALINQIKNKKLKPRGQAQQAHSRTRRAHPNIIAIIAR